MAVKYFEELEIWKEARRIAGEIYHLTKDSKFTRDFGLSGQIQKAVVSTMSNIAEGFERGGNQEFIQFLYIAKGSCGEVRSQVYLALDQGYLKQEKADKLVDSLKRLSTMISNLIDYIKQSGMKGEKFHGVKQRIDRVIRGSTILNKRAGNLRRIERVELIEQIEPKACEVLMYLSANKIAALEGVRRVHTLNPGAIRLDKSLGDEVGLKNIGIHIMTIAPGDKSTEFHTHKYEDEAIYVLSGHGTEVIGDEKHKIGPGDFIGCPAGGAAHETVNDGTEPLVCLVIGQRLPQDVVDYPHKGKRLYRNSGQRDMVDYPNIEKR